MAANYGAGGDSALGYKFKIKVDGLELPAVTEVTGLKLEVEKIELKSQNSKTGEYIISHMPGPVKAGEITITRYLSDDKELVNWWTQVLGGKIKESRKTASVQILDVDGSTPVRTYKFEGVWVKSIETSSFKAGSNDVMTEKAVLTYTGGKIE